MMSFRQAKKFFVIVISTLILVATVVFNFGTTSAWAATLPAPVASQAQFISMNRAEAITKNLEGQAQEALGNVTGDRKNQMMGKLKQTDASHQNMIENVKDGIGDLFN
jgi:uncharacterized protein YjbJ (UPF0337 family)